MAGLWTPAQWTAYKAALSSTSGTSGGLAGQALADYLRKRRETYGWGTQEQRTYSQYMAEDPFRRARDVLLGHDPKYVAINVGRRGVAIADRNTNAFVLLLKDARWGKLKRLVSSAAAITVAWGWGTAMGAILSNVGGVLARGAIKIAGWSAQKKLGTSALGGIVAGKGWKSLFWAGIIFAGVSGFTWNFRVLPGGHSAGTYIMQLIATPAAAGGYVVAKALEAAGVAPPGSAEALWAKWTSTL